MTPEEQTIAIAEACEWKPTTDGGICWDSDGNAIITPPDYPKDLNAVHHFENYVKQDDPHAYACYASDLFEKYGSDAISLPASIRAEELLKTIGKWIY